MPQEYSVKLKIYRIKNYSILSIFGVNVYHTALEFENMEFGFGKTDDPKDNGVYDITPGNFDDGVLIKSIDIGNATRRQFFTKLEKIKSNFVGGNYNLFSYNCNHFTNEFSLALFDKGIPSEFFSCFCFGKFFSKFL